MILVLSGGRQSRDAGVLDRQHGPLYDRGILARLDPARGSLEAWVTGEQRFGASSVDGDHVLTCTPSAVVRVAPDGTTATLAHPWLADVHHALVVDGITHAASTATDGIVALGAAPRFLPTAPGIGPPTGPWTGGPSLTHPNFVFRVDGVLHATRGTRGDAVATGDLGRPWAIAPVVVHDGIVTGDGVWFTRVDGHLVLVDPATGQIAQSVALQRPGDGPEPLGWCRGLCISDGIAWVGFSRLRATRLRRHLAWARGRLRGRPIATRRATRVDGFELSTGERVASVPLAGVEIDALFGIVALPGRTSG